MVAVMSLLHLTRATLLIPLTLLCAHLGLNLSTATAAWYAGDPVEGATFEADPKRGVADPLFMGYWDSGAFDGRLGSMWNQPWIKVSASPAVDASGKFTSDLTLGEALPLNNSASGWWGGKVAGSFLLKPGVYYWQLQVATYRWYEALGTTGCCDDAISPPRRFVVTAPAAASPPPVTSPTTEPAPSGLSVKVVRRGKRSYRLMFNATPPSGTTWVYAANVRRGPAFRKNVWRSKGTLSDKRVGQWGYWDYRAPAAPTTLRFCVAVAATGSSTIAGRKCATFKGR